MDTNQFAKYIAENFECGVGEAKTLIDVFSCSVYMALSEGHKIDIDSLGTFATTYIPKKETVKYRNDGNVLTVRPEKLLPTFRPGSDLKMACAF